MSASFILLLLYYHDPTEFHLQIQNLKHRCHNYKFCSLIGGIVPDLIEIPFHVHGKALESLVDLGYSISENYVSVTNFRHVFDNIPKIHQEHCTKFLKQLTSSDRHQLDWKFPAISIIIPQLIRPHCDSLNPDDNDTTFQVNTWVSTKDLSEIQQKTVKDKLGETARIYITFLFYQRQCVERYCNLRKRIDDYHALNGKDIAARAAVVHVMGAVESAMNYKGRFFSKSGFATESLRCSHDHPKLNKYFDGKLAATPECIDRLVSANHMNIFYYFY